MNNPNTSSIPGMGAMTDTFDFMKNLWSGMSMPGLPGMKIPGMVMPTLSVEEINKQIKDLKSVESWLTMNLTMLRSTIQALEVQSATITTIQSMSSSLAEAMKPSAKPAAAPTTEKSGKPIFESPFASPSDKKQAELTDAPAADPGVKTEAAPKSSAEGFGTIPPTGDSSSLIPPMANPAAWWGMLQDQFKQAVDTAAAMAPDMPAAMSKSMEGVKTEKAEKPAKSKEAKAAKPTRKPSAKTAAKSKKAG